MNVTSHSSSRLGAANLTRYSHPAWEPSVSCLHLWKWQLLSASEFAASNRETTSCRVEVPLSTWLLVWLARVWAAAPRFLQSIWSCSAEQEPSRIYLEMQSGLRQIRLGK